MLVSFFIAFSVCDWVCLICKCYDSIENAEMSNEEKNILLYGVEADRSGKMNEMLNSSDRE